jgi:HAD superfamily hydrolase (TIGR01549 family)
VTGTQPRYSDLRAILFDFDGTLLDSFPIHRYAFKTTLDRFNIEMSEADFLANYSPDWTRVYAAAGLPEKDWALADRIWLEAEASRQAALFPGIPDTLHLLAKQYTLGLVTAGTKSRVLEDLRRTQIKGYFKTIITGDDVREKKPSPEGLIQALESLQMDSQEALYVGDTTVDWETAQAAGMRFVSILSEVSRIPKKGEYHQISSVNDLRVLLNLAEC